MAQDKWYREQFSNKLPQLIEDYNNKEKTQLRIGFPNQSMAEEAIQKNRMNLGLNVIFGENPKQETE